MNKIIVCNECGYMENDWYKENPPLNKNTSIDMKFANQYCEEQLLKYTHKNCKPIWCDKCGMLDKYLMNY